MNEERLAQRAAAGDAAAFEAIFRRYHQDLYRYCLATVGNPQDAQDALQNTMVKAMQALPGERREIKLKPWLYRVAHNEAIETLRRRREGVELDAEREAASWEIAEATEARARLRQLLTDLEELPERQRSALVMRELAGLEFEEIAASFGTSPAVVRQTLYEARLSLHQMGEGREMSCESVMKALSDADGRVTRRRDLRAHLRGCASCRGFREEIGERRGELAAIAPLPIALSAGLLHALTEAQAGTAGVAAGSSAAAGGAGGAAASGAAGGAAVSSAGGAAASGSGASLAGAIGAGVGKTVAGATIVKSAATIAVVAAVGVSAADRGGMIDVPLGGTDEPEKQIPPQRATSTDVDTADPGPAAPNATGRKADAAEMPSDRGKRAGAGKQGPKASSKATGAETPGRSSRSPSSSGKAQAAPAHGKPESSPAGGKSQAGNRGAPQDLPPASSRGQESATAHKPPPARSTAGTTTRPAPKPERPPKSDEAAIPPPVSEVPETDKGASGTRGAAGGQVEAPAP